MQALKNMNLKTVNLENDFLEDDLYLQGKIVHSESKDKVNFKRVLKQRTQERKQQRKAKHGVRYEVE
jgi:hypothetical protein